MIVLEARGVTKQFGGLTAVKSVDLQVHDDELGFLGQAATAFGIPLVEAQETFDELDEAITGLA